MARFGFQRYERNPDGYRAILQSDAVAKILSGKGQKVKAAIESRLDLEGDWTVTVSTIVGRTRARTLVSGVPMSVEQDQGVLGSAIDAGRG